MGGGGGSCCPRPLEELLLGHNPGVGDAGAAALAAVLAHDAFPELRDLHLHDTGLELCARPLFEALVSRRI